MRKRTKLLLVLLILLCVAVFIGYRMLDRIRTDTQPPEITLGSQTLTLSVTDPKDALLQGVTATDKADGNVTDLLVVESVSLLDSTGRASVSYAAFDKSGNVAKAQQEVLYTDYEAPRFVLTSPLLYRYGSSFDVLSTISATDTIDGDIQHRIRATSLDNASISAMGSHDVQFQVTNSLGDTVSLVFPVEVYDPQLYDATLTLKDYLVYLNAGDSFNAVTYLDTFTLAGKNTTLNGRVPSSFSLKTTGTVQTDTPGVYAIEYLVTYTDKSTTTSVSGMKYTAYSKLIVVVEG